MAYQYMSKCRVVKESCDGKSLCVLSGILSSTWRKFDPDTAYMVCISVSLGFPYMSFISLGFPYMVILQTFKHKRSGCGDAMGCHGRPIVPGAAIVTA